MAGICCVSTHHTLKEVIEDTEVFHLLTRPSQCGFFFELRLERYQDITLHLLEEVFSHYPPHRLVITWGGTDRRRGALHFNIKEGEGRKWIQAFHRAGVGFLDIDFTLLKQVGFTRSDLLPSSSTTQLIVSHHEWMAGLPLDALRTLRQEAEGQGADVVKIALTPLGFLDALPLLQLMKEEGQWKRPLIGIAMGEKGAWSRLLGPQFPHSPPFTYASLIGSQGTAPGQLTWLEFETIYRYFELSPATKVYGIIGDPVAHSLSPLLHNSAFAATGFPGIYIPFHLTEDPVWFMKEFAPLIPIQGLSITIPHKIRSLSACTLANDLSHNIGAINTALFAPESGWTGFNTDATAAIASLEEALEGTLAGKTVLVIGAGGVARSVAFPLQKQGARVIICSRHPDKSMLLARDIGAEWIPFELACSGQCQAQVIIHATPIGMAPHTEEIPIPLDSFPPQTLLFDLVYHPVKTAWLRQGERRGHPILYGYTHFLKQGASQFKYFTGLEAPLEIMEQVIRNSLQLGRD
ncbi:type I 3-dehydroquinate dehydratase [Pajaroellobacter abortibovis]|uniref:Shikimate dehydrogenase (NADP(+)) n=1 Tax=Pajaroellobacter abortibovis TaxID=1882918 RepID=A0A1L6MZ64_9BACT|nr:type I 3-dehydroquinate dehydratase [Pajaroellobacter abortibovis]APS00707.1 hypothetical protein BCY86_08470 [Pajaroellobacter abortibovis]